MLLQAFYTIRSERQLMERLEFASCSAGSSVFRRTSGPGTIRRSPRTAIACSTARSPRSSRRGAEPTPGETAAVDQHFSADGTLIKAWASLKSFKPRPDAAEGAAEGEGGPPEGGAGGDGAGGRNAEVDFKGERRSNATHRSTTDPEALLYRKGPGMEARLCYIGHGLMENRSGLIVDTRLTLVSGHAERLAALEMIAPHADRPRAITLGADKGYDAADFVEELRTLNVRPHVAQKCHSAVDGRTTRHAGYVTSQRIRKRIEEVFGWIKTVAGLRKTRFVGRAKTDWAFTFAAAAYNLVRLPKLLAAAG